MSLSTILSSLQKGFLKNVLSGAGLTLGTSAVLLVSLNTAITIMQNNFNNIGTTVLGLAGLSGFDVGFSLILGAIVTRYVQNTTLSLRKK